MIESNLFVYWFRKFKSFLWSLHYKCFKFLARRQIKEVYEKMELDVRTDFFNRVCPEKKDKFEEAYYKVWLPLYNNYIK